MIVFTETIDQSDLSSECWDIQIRGPSTCKTCDLKDTSACGGRHIRETGKNSKGRTVPL